GAAGPTGATGPGPTGPTSGARSIGGGTIVPVPAGGERLVDGCGAPTAGKSFVTSVRFPATSTAVIFTVTPSWVPQGNFTPVRELAGSVTSCQYVFGLSVARKWTLVS